MNNKPATPAPKKEENQSGLGTAAKVGLGVAMGAATTIGAKAAYDNLSANTIVEEGAEGVLNDASAMAHNLTAQNATAELEVLEEQTTVEEEQVDPNNITLEGEPVLPGEEGTNLIDDFVFESDPNDLIDPDDMPYPASYVELDDPVAFIEDEPLIEDQPEDFYSYDDDMDISSDPVDDMIL